MRALRPERGTYRSPHGPALARTSCAASQLHRHPVPPPVVHDVLRSTGAPLDPHTRESMELHFGHDFGSVRVHAGERAAASARAVDALAYTVGDQIVFGSRAYAPATDRGKRLLAHELAHVVQQAGAPPANGPLTVGDPHGPLEREADVAAVSSPNGLARETQTLRRKGDDLSFELADAPRASVATSLTGLTDAEMRVLAWLQSHASEIAAAEKKWQIDRRAIAGAIAWEALKNVSSFSMRASGPGKVHAQGWLGDDVIAKQVEEAGFLPKQPDVASRQKVLATTAGSIDYIGAIMRALAEEAARAGFADIRCDPITLTNAYQGFDLPKWRALLAAKKKGSTFTAGNPMALWVTHHLRYLEEGVGTPEVTCL